MDKFKHKCIKPTCSNTYEDNDPDAYYCELCKENNNKIALEINAKIASTGTTRSNKSDLQAFDEIRKKKNVNFVNIRDLGITL